VLGRLRDHRINGARMELVLDVDPPAWLMPGVIVYEEVGEVLSGQVVLYVERGTLYSGSPQL